MERNGVSRRELLARGGQLAAAASAAPYLIAPVAEAGRGGGRLGLVGVDHVGITVPDIEQITEGRGGNGPTVELFAYTAPDQDRTLRRNSDWGGHHIAFYVRHIEKAVERLERKGEPKLLGPFAVTEGPAVGQTINYFKAPFGYIEPISYPRGMAYESTAPIDLWDPRDNKR